MSDRDAFETIAEAAGFHDFDVSGNGCYCDDFLQHFYAGWEARGGSRQALSSCSEIPNHSVTGNAVAMGDLTDNDDEEHERSILIQFGSLEDFYAARASGQCRFTVFGGGV